MQAETKWIYYHLKICNYKCYTFPKITPNLPTLFLKFTGFQADLYFLWQIKMDFRPISCIQYRYSNWFHLRKVIFLLQSASWEFLSPLPIFSQLLLYYLCCNYDKSFPLFCTNYMCKCVSLTQRLQNCLIWNFRFITCILLTTALFFGCFSHFPNCFSNEIKKSLCLLQRGC